MVLILFGQTGAGKSYIGKILESHFGYYFWDADQALLPEMKQCIAEKRYFTDEMRDDFTQKIIDKINDLVVRYPRVVIAQALYKEKNRNQVRTVFPSAVFIYIDTDFNVALQRIEKREDWIDKDYALLISASFDSPRIPHIALKNDEDNDEAIVAQLKKLLPLNESLP